MSTFLTHAPYLLFVALVAVGVYIIVTDHNLLKALMGLYVIQTAIILYFILVGARTGATIPITDAAGTPMVNPLPHALMLTAIVVGVATLGVGLALLRRIHAETGSLEDSPATEDPLE